MSLYPYAAAIKIFFVLAYALVVFVAPAKAQSDERQRFPQVSTETPHGVDLQTGRFVKDGTDLAIGPLSVDHFLTTRGEGPFAGDRAFPSVATSLKGRSWRYESGTGSGRVDNTFIQLGRQKIVFHNTSSGTYFPFDSSNTGWKMVPSGNNNILTNKSGMVYTFSPLPSSPANERALISTESSDGHIITNEYGASGELRIVRSNKGYAVVLDYTSTSVTVCGYNLAVTHVTSSTTCSGAPITAVYSYNASGQMTSITDVEGDVVTLQYTSGIEGITCVTKPNSSVCAVQNEYWAPDPNQPLVDGTKRTDHVIKQTTADGEEWTYNHIAMENFNGDYTPYPGEIFQTFGNMTSPIPGASANAVYGNGFLQQLNTAQGVTAYEYSTQFAYAVVYKDNFSGPHYYSVYPSRITYPEGNNVYFTRDYADNVTSRTEFPKSGSGETSRTVIWEYPATNIYASPTICNVADVLCDKPTKVTEPGGIETDFTYDATHGGLLTKTGPADDNGVRPQTRYTYAQRYAWIKNSSGTYVQASAPIWLLVAEEYCKSSAASGSGCAGGASDEVVTAYDYGPDSGPNNLLLRGTAVTADGETLRSCVTYDELGRKTSQTPPRANVGSCP